MRRAVLISWAAGLLLACVAAGAVVQSQQGRALVMPGAANVQLRRAGLSHVVVTYQLPQGRSVHDLRSHMRRLGWQRIDQATNVQQPTLLFVRSSPPRIIRDFATVTLSADRRSATVDVQRCVRLYRWSRCF